MRRAYWSADYAEAHIVVAMLRANDVDAHVFDRNMVRQDWFQTLAFGGYRVMVADADVERTTALLEDYRAGRLALDDSITDQPACPCCGMPGREDAGPRRWVFALLISADLIAVAGLLLVGNSSGRVPSTIVCTSLSGTLMAVALMRYLKNRYRCTVCGARWRARAALYAEAAPEVEAASHSGNEE